VSWILIAIVSWLVVAGVVGMFAWALARSAALEDRAVTAALEDRAVAADTPVDRRAGGDRRSSTRPWAGRSPGRRAEDLLRDDLADDERALLEAERRLAEVEARRSA
jgi:hypothetical protein